MDNCYVIIPFLYKPVIPLLWNKEKDICLQKDLYSSIPSSFIHNEPKLETTQMSINIWWMGKQIVVYPYNGMMLSDKKKQSADLIKISDSQKHYAQWRKPDTKKYILCDSILETLEKTKLICSYRKQLRGQGWCGVWETDFKKAQRSFLA